MQTKSEYITINRPRCLYKYFSINDNTIDTLQNSELFFAPVELFNDPFENTFHFNKVFIKDKIYSTENRKFVTLETFNKYLNEYIDLVKNKFIKKVGVCCFSIFPTNFLMWSHYANNHKGICVEFELEQDLDFFWEVQKVDYRDKLPIINTLINDTETEKQIFDILYIKSIEWQYEQEFRLINKIGLHKFNKKSLTRIILGCKITDELKDKVISIIKTNYPRTKIVCSSINDFEYKIDYKYLENNEKVEFKYLYNFENVR